MKFVLVLALCCAANAWRYFEACEHECLQAALTYRIAKLSKIPESDIEKFVMRDCENYAEVFHIGYECSKAVPMTLTHKKIPNLMEKWDADSPSDKGTVRRLRRYCRTACRTAYYSEKP